MNYAVVLIVACAGVPLVWGHGRLMEPPGRSSAFRYGFKTPANYNDMQLSCGGVGVQYGKNGGKCGICGDPYNEAKPRPNEFGGTYGPGTIVRTYKAGQTIQIALDITANHKGWNEISICPDPKDGVTTEDCLDMNVLKLRDGSTRWNLPAPFLNQVYRYTVQLPAGLTCNRCTLRWRWNIANSFGCDDSGCGIGYGDQEQFYGCADVQITGDGGSVTPFRPAPSTPAPTTPSSSVTTKSSSWTTPTTWSTSSWTTPTTWSSSSWTTPTTWSSSRWTTPTTRSSTYVSRTQPSYSPVVPTTAPRATGSRKCEAHPYYKSYTTSFDEWCQRTCLPAFCPVPCVCS